MSFEVETIGQNPDQMANRLDSLSNAVSGSTDEGLKETAIEIKADIEETAPVDTGDYKDSWELEEVAEDEIWVISRGDDAPHNQFVMLPNSKMVGSSKADLPSVGVLHNVKGVARNHQNDLVSNIKNAIEDVISNFTVR